MIPVPILKRLINQPCIYTDPHGKNHTGILKSVALGNLQRKSYKVEIEVFHAESEIFETYVTTSEHIRPIVKHLDDLSHEDLMRFFKLYFENPTGLSSDGAVINFTVLKVVPTGEPHQWEVEGEATVTEPENEDFEPITDIQSEKWTLPPGSMEFLTIPAFDFLMEKGVDVYGLKQANLAIHISECPGLVDVDGFTMPVDSIIARGFQKEDITKMYVFNRG